MRRRTVRGLATTLVGLTILGLAGVPPAEAGTPSTCASTYSDTTLRSCLASATDAYVASFTSALAAHGITATPPIVAPFRAVPVNPCVDGSDGDVAVASFWCDVTLTVYVSRMAAPWWTREYARQARLAGVLASDARTTHRTQRRLLRGFALQGVTTEFAHELGHWAQQQQGTFAWYQERIALSSDRLAGHYLSAVELSADCLAGWVQGRSAASGSWRDSALIRWAQHATIAELGADMTGMRPGFRFPRDVPLIAHGGPYSRLRLYDEGYRIGRANGDGLTRCAQQAAAYTRTPAPPVA